MAFRKRGRLGLEPVISPFQEHVQQYDYLSYYFDGRVNSYKLIDDNEDVLTLQELV